MFLTKSDVVLPNPSQLCLQHYLYLENDELTVRCIYIANKWSNAYIPKYTTYSHISPDSNIPLQTYASYLLTAVQLQCSTTPTQPWSYELVAALCRLSHSPYLFRFCPMMTCVFLTSLEPYSLLKDTESFIQLHVSPESHGIFSYMS